MKFKISLLLSLIVSAGGAFADEIPAVPAEIISGAKAGQPTGKPEGNNTIKISAGSNTMLTVSQGYSNRLVTPFVHPEVVSTSLTGMSENGECGELCIKDSVIYVATDKDYPVSMFITEKGTQNAAISLTLIPKKVPPKEYFLTFDDDQKGLFTVQTGSREAEKWETSQSYLDTIKTLLRSIALNQVPNGYTMQKTTNAVRVPICRSRQIKTTFINGQYITGYNLSVFIGVAENISNQTVQINETMCGDWDVAAVAAFPNTVLEAGQKTELYVVKKLVHEEPVATFRPNLLR